jgi:hypothetical protein
MSFIIKLCYFSTDMDKIVHILFFHQHICFNIFYSLLDISIMYVLTNILVGRFLAYRYVKKIIEKFEYNWTVGLTVYQFFRGQVSYKLQYVH